MTVSIQQAQSELPALIDRLAQDQEVVITRDGRPVAKLIAQAPRTPKPREPGWAKGIITHLSDDFDAPLTSTRE